MLHLICGTVANDLFTNGNFRMEFYLKNQKPTFPVSWRRPEIIGFYYWNYLLIPGGWPWGKIKLAYTPGPALTNSPGFFKLAEHQLLKAFGFWGVTLPKKGKEFPFLEVLDPNRQEKLPFRAQKIKPRLRLAQFRGPTFFTREHGVPIRGKMTLQSITDFQ